MVYHYLALLSLVGLITATPHSYEARNTLYPRSVARPTVTTANSQQQVALVSYIWPDTLDNSGQLIWDRILGYNKQKLSIVVANVLNGPDSEVKASWNMTIVKAAQQGKKVLGYVRTGYLGLSPTSSSTPFEPFVTRLGSTAVVDWIAQAERDIDSWYSFYGNRIGGIFFDEAFDECQKDDYDAAQIYKLLSDYTKRKYPGAMTVLNPGSAVPKCYENSADTLVTFEGGFESYKTNSYSRIDWTPSDSRKIWHIVHDVPEASVAQIAQLTRTNNAGYVHITSGVGDNPYGMLSTDSYMQKLLGTVAGGTPAVSTPLTILRSVKTLVSPAITGIQSDYTSITLQWSYSATDPYSFMIYCSDKPCAMVPGNVRSATLPGFSPGISQSISIRASGEGGEIGNPSSPQLIATKALSGSPISNVKISTTANETTYEAQILTPATVTRLFLTDAAGQSKYPAWPISYPSAKYSVLTAHYMLEGRTLYKYDDTAIPDASGNYGWNWKVIASDIKIDRIGYNYKWYVPVGTSTKDVDSRNVIIQIEGYTKLASLVAPCPSNMLPDNSYACSNGGIGAGSTRT